MEILRNLTVRAAAGDATEKRDPASEQQGEFATLQGRGAIASSLHNPPATEADKAIGLKTATINSGAPAADLEHSVTVGRRGPILLQDTAMLEMNAQFNRARPPERPVHSKGSGAFGNFEVTHDISNFTKAAPFVGSGKKTPVLVRFSTVEGERGSPDTVRDPRGFAIKFYSEMGNFDLVCNNQPVFWIRDPILFPAVNNAQMRNPVTNLKDADMFWDFMSNRPETLHLLTMIMSPRGIPDGFRHQHGFGINTFKLVNAEGQAVWAKFHLITNQGIKNLPAEVAAAITGADPDYSTRDLYNAIARGDYPSWDMFIQTMTLDQANKVPFNPFDDTKTWPHKDFPLQPVGRLTLDSNPSNFHAEIEQAAFCPANMIPGIEASPDKILQGRLFAYTDAQRHRIGPNFNQIPVNCPYRSGVATYHKDGAMRVDSNRGGAPTFYPNTFGGPKPDLAYREHVMHVEGDVDRFNDDDDDNYSQVRILWERVMSPSDRDTTSSNIAGGLAGAAARIREKQLAELAKVHPDFARMVKEKIDKFAAMKEKLGEKGVFSGKAADTQRAAMMAGLATEPIRTPVDEHGKEAGVVSGHEKGEYEDKPSARKSVQNSAE